MAALAHIQLVNISVLCLTMDAPLLFTLHFKSKYEFPTFPSFPAGITKSVSFQQNRFIQQIQSIKCKLYKHIWRQRGF